jgi:hypothetical protein
MKQLSFKNRIALLYLVTTALLIAFVFCVIYISVSYNEYSDINEDIESESQKHLTEIAVSNNSFRIIHLVEWMEREHNTEDVNPVYVQFIDSKKNVVEKSPNLKRNLQFNSEIPFNILFDYQLEGKSLRQIQLPIYQGKLTMIIDKDLSFIQKKFKTPCLKNYGAVTLKDDSKYREYYVALNRMICPLSHTKSFM